MLAFLLAGAVVATDLPWRFELSAQAGAGVAADAGVALLRPHAAVDGPNFRAAIAPQLWLGIADGAWRNDWQSPETYAGFVQHLAYEGFDDRLMVRVAPLQHATVGEGLLVDGYRGSTDFMRPRPGGYGRWEDGRVRVELWSASVVAAELLAAHLAVAPLGWGAEPSQRWRVFAEGAGNVSRDEGGLAVGTSFRVVEVDRFALAPFLGAAAWNDRAGGAHLGVAGEAMRDASTYVRLRMDAAFGSDAYVPGRFGPLPQRVSLVETPWRLRARLESAFGPWTMNVGVAGVPRWSTSIDATSTLSVDRWRIAASWVALDRRTPSAFLTLDQATYAQIEGAFRVQGAVYVFTAFERGPTTTGPTALRWIAGIGGAVGNSLE